MSELISLSISKVLGKTSITIVAYNDNVRHFISGNFILVSKLEDNGIYTMTYILQDSSDLLKTIQRQMEDIEFDFNTRIMYEKMLKINKFFQYKREKIVGNQKLLLLKDKLLNEDGAQASDEIRLYDIVEHPILGRRTEIRKFVDMEYRKNINVASSDACDSDFNEIIYKKVNKRDYKINPKINYKFCEPEEKCLTFRYGDEERGYVEIQIIYETNKLCTIHRIKNIFIRKNVIKRYMYKHPIENNQNQEEGVFIPILPFPNKLDCHETQIE